MGTVLTHSRSIGYLAPRAAMLLNTTRTDQATSGTLVVPGHSGVAGEEKDVKLESDFLKLGLFSLRRQGVQLNLGLLSGVLLAILFTVLVYFAFQDVNVDDSSLTVWRNVLLAVGTLATVIGILTIVRALTTGVRVVAMEVWIRRMGQGDLEYKVELEGNDEITAIAESLEELRQRSIRVVRLNLVEKLAQDLESKNAELEDVLGQLRSAQDQIVTRQKLTELGELAAGVAHEIKNPLNFVRNFAEATDDLIAELRESIEQHDYEERAEIAEIINDIAENLERVETHASRADRIVDDMLNLGGHGGNFQPTDLNDLLRYSADLAYNGSKSLHPDLELTIEEDLDADMGEVTIIAEDVGRVIFNIVNNSCYATDEQRIALGGDSATYSPRIWLKTQRKDDSIEIRVRDNGTGIDPEIVTKIFNPFFTTKPTDKGTGLGLSIANDIIREHGGSIEPKSQLGEYTEMLVSIPIDIPDETGSESGRYAETVEMVAEPETT